MTYQKLIEQQMQKTVKTSSSKGKSGQRRQGQRHQNKVAFTPNKYSPHALMIASLPSSGLCQHCLEIINWKKRMNKYKPLTHPKTCITCHLKTVREAYHVLCSPCASQADCCAKCRVSVAIAAITANAGINVHGIANPLVSSYNVLFDTEQQEAVAIAKLNERSRRSYLRKRDAEDWEGAAKIIEALEASEALYDDDDGDSSDDEILGK